MIELTKDGPTIFGMKCALIPKGFDPYEAGIRGASKILPYLPHLSSKHAKFLAILSILLHQCGVAKIKDFGENGEEIWIRIEEPFTKDLSFEIPYIEGIASACYGIPVIDVNTEGKTIKLSFLEVVD